MTVKADGLYSYRSVLKGSHFKINILTKVKVLSVYLIKPHAMKRYGGV
jgi:hypothetical protein